MKVCLGFSEYLASFARHCKWLESTIYTQNATQCIPIWSKFIPFSDHVTTCFPWSKTKDTSEITELSVDVLHMAKVKALELQLKELNCGRIEHSLDEHSVGGEWFGQSKNISDKLDQLITKLTIESGVFLVPEDESIGEENMVNSYCKDDLSLEEEIEFTVECDKDVCKIACMLLWKR